jgi:hypothetical protein
MLDEVQQLILEIVDFPQVGLPHVGRQDSHIATVLDGEEA